MRFVLPLLIAMASTPVEAEWVKAHDDIETVFYYDAAIERQGNLVRVWTLEDLKQPGEAGELSRRWLNEFDCKERSVRVLSVAAFRGQLASGRVLVSSKKPSEWRRIRPGRPFDSLLPVFCR